MLLPTLFLWSGLLSPTTPAQTIHPPAQTAPFETYVIDLRETNPGALVSMLKSQLSDDAKLLLEPGILTVEAPAADIATLKTVMEQFSFGNQKPEELLPNPSKELQLVKDGQAVNLMELIIQYVTDTEIPLFATESTRNQLAEIDAVIEGKTSLAPEQALFYLETLVAQNEATFQISKVDGQRTLQVILNRSMHRTPGHQGWFVEEKDLFQYANHPALRIGTVVELANTDVRSLSNTIRQLVHDPNTQMIIPAGSSNSMILMGQATWVYELSKVLRMTDSMQKLSADKRKLANTPVRQVIVLKHGDASGVAQVIKGIVGPKPPEVLTEAAGTQRAHQPQKESAFRIEVDPRLNAIVVRCSPDEMESVLDLAAQLDIEVK